MDDVFIATEYDGSQWVSLEDYNKLKQAWLLSELALLENLKKLSEFLECKNEKNTRSKQVDSP